MDKISGSEAIQMLAEGNKRFVSGNLAVKELGKERRDELATKGQKPFAAVLTCSDSRVPPELLFDQALGDIFVIRNAGNVVDPVTLGSVEYAVEHLGTPLVVILGHEKCGAVQATVDGGEAPGSIAAIVNKIKPSLHKAEQAGIKGSALYEATCDENVKSTIADLKKSPIIEHFIKDGKVKVIGAKYYLSSGKVIFNE